MKSNKPTLSKVNPPTSVEHQEKDENLRTDEDTHSKCLLLEEKFSSLINERLDNANTELVRLLGSLGEKLSTIINEKVDNTNTELNTRLVSLEEKLSTIINEKVDNTNTELNTRVVSLEEKLYNLINEKVDNSNTEINRIFDLPEERQVDPTTELNIGDHDTQSSTNLDKRKKKNRN